MLCFWVINSARLLGIKHYQKALELRVAPQGRAYQEDQSSRVPTKVFQAGLWGLALLTALLRGSNLIPSLTAGWWAWLCTQKGKPHLEGMKPGPLSVWLQFLYKFCWMRATYQLDMEKNHRRKRFPSSILLPTSPQNTLALVKIIFYVKIQSPALLESPVVFGQTIFAGFFNLLQQCDPWCYWLLMYIHNFTLSTIYPLGAHFIVEISQIHHKAPNIKAIASLYGCQKKIKRV